MTIHARSAWTRHRKSFEAGQQLAEEVKAGLPCPPLLVIVHATVNHQQPRLLEGLRSVLGEEVHMLGCSGQGVMSRDGVQEEGYAASVMALAGDNLQVSVAKIEDIQENTRSKGAQLSAELRRGLPAAPSATVVFYDPLMGADMSVFLEELDQGLDCPIVGGAAAHFFSAAMTTTFQYIGTEVFSKGAVAVSLSGDIGIHMAYSSGVAPVGVEMKITKASGNYITELDGRPAMDVWKEVTGSSGSEDPIANAALAIGLPVDEAGQEHMIRAAFVYGLQDQGLMLQTAAPEGATVQLYHRTTEDVLEGSTRLGEELAQQLNGKPLRALLGFECGGRTLPFLGTEATNEENAKLRERLGPNAAFSGVICWGEIYPVGGKARFHNYAFPVLAITD